jgi:hypothetical protein
MPAERASESEAPRFVELRILDQTAGQRIRVTAPVGVTLRLPDGLHQVRLMRYHPAFTRTQPPAATTATNRSPAQAAKPEAEGSGKEGKADQSGEAAQAKAKMAKPRRGPAELPPIEDNPAVFLRLYRKGEPVSQSWVFKDYPTLFQPRNMRYTFYLLDSATGGNN